MNRITAYIIGTCLLFSLSACNKKLTYPDISKVSFTLLSGKRVTVKQLHGKPIIATFWATTCASCIKEIPDLIKLHQLYHQRGLVIVAIAMPYDRPDHILEFARDRRLPYHVALDIDAKVTHAFGGIRVTPNNFLINPDGRIHQQHVGILDLRTTENWLDAILSPRS